LAILRPVWTTSSLVSSWVSLSCCTVRAPLTPMPPDMLLTKPATTAPVAPLTAARPTRAAPLTVWKLPPTYRVELVAARAVAWAPALAVKPATGAPVVRLIEAILRLLTR
jgi:hypothetical protein